MRASAIEAAPLAGGLADLRTDYDHQAGRSLDLPVAGTRDWTAIGTAGALEQGTVR